jgi:hypothetical protein
MLPGPLGKFLYYTRFIQLAFLVPHGHDWLPANQHMARRFDGLSQASDGILDLTRNTCVPAAIASWNLNTSPSNQRHLGQPENVSII